MFREGDYPPLRGTMTGLGKEALLFTRGSVPIYLRVPRPIRERRRNTRFTYDKNRAAKGGPFSSNSVAVQSPPQTSEPRSKGSLFSFVRAVFITSEPKFHIIVHDEV